MTHKTMISVRKQTENIIGSMQTKSPYALFLMLPLLFVSTILNGTINYSFNVFINSCDKICAASAETNDILFSGTDASEVINAAIQSISPTQGEIRIRAREYMLSKSIVIDRHGITLSGDGRKSGGYGSPPYLKSNSNSNIDMLVLRKGGEKLHSITVKDISFYVSGSSNANSGIHDVGCSDFSVIQNVEVYSTETGIYLQGGPAGAVDATQLQLIYPQQRRRGLVLEYYHYTKVFGDDFSDNLCNLLPSNLQTGIYLTNNQYGISIGIKINGSAAVRNRSCEILIGKGIYDISIQGRCNLGGNKNNGLLVSNEGSALDADLPTSININGLIVYDNANASIKIEKANYVLISGCITSENKYPNVPDREQQYNIFIASGSKNVMVQVNMSYQNTREQNFNKTQVAKIMNNF
jgi:hypothetical protein